ncbi:MAG TPA: hypothetical protein VIG24_13270 [Acidimicrobiia bacterium]
MSEISVVLFPEPFRECEPKVYPVPAGHTILEIFGRSDIPAIVQCDGDYIDAEHWHEVIPTEWLIVHRVPQGNIGRILGTIAVIALAAVAGPMVAGSFAALTTGTGAAATLTTAGLAVSAGISAAVGIVGNLALNALIPPPTPSLGGGGGIQDLPTITAQSNQVRPFAPIPRAYGEVTWYPPIPMTALPYTELQGQDQHLRMMVCLGYGPLEIGGVQVGGPSDDMIVKRAPATADFSGFDFNNNGWTAVDVSSEGGDETALTGNPIKIGGTAISEFEDVEFEIGRPDQVTLYSQSVVEATVNVSMPLSTDTPTEGRDITINDNQAVVRTTEADTKEVSLDLFFPSLFNLDSRGRSKWARVLFRIEYSVSGAGSWTQAGPDWSISGRERRPVRQGRRVVLPSAGTWDIRLTRVSTFLERSGGDNTWVTDATWTVMRSINRNVKPFDVDGTVVMALKIRASEQLSGRLDTLSVKTTSVLPTWNGSAWVDAATRNPAWVYADILSGSATRTPLEKAKVDGTALKAWADFNDTENLYFDGVIESEGTVFDRCRDAASAGFGSWSIEDDGKVSIVRDVTATPKMLVSPRNSADFRSEHAYPDLPHALRVQFIDATTLERVERIVYDDGYSKSGGGGDTAATKFEQLETIGVRTPEQAWKVGRYHLAQLRLRSETYHWRHDIQSLVYRRGDTVEIAYDVILVGLKWGRIKSLTTNVDGDATAATVDELLLMEAATDYALKIQRQDGTIVTEGISTVTPGTQSVTFAAPVSGLSVGDHFMHGVLGSESLLARISKIQPQGDLQAAITAVPAAEDIFDAWDGTIPTFDPVITEPVDESLLPPPVPVVTSVTSGLDTSAVDANGGSQLAITAAFNMPPGLDGVRVEAHLRTHETIAAGEVAAPWRFGSDAPSDDGSVKITGLEQGALYDVRVRSRRGNRVSSWTAVFTNTVGDGTIFGRVAGQNLLGSTAAVEQSTSGLFLPVFSLTLADIGADVGSLISASADVKHTAADSVRIRFEFRDASNLVVGSLVNSENVLSDTYARARIEAAEVPDGAVSVLLVGRNNDSTATMFWRRRMINLGPVALPFEEPPTRVNRGEVEEGADVTGDHAADVDALLTINGPAEAASTKGVIDAVGEVTTSVQTDGTGSWVTAEEDTITVAAGEEVLVTTALLYRGSGATPGSGNLRILRGATVVVGPIGVTLNPTLYAAWVMPVYETPGAGSHTYKLQYQGGFGGIDMNVAQSTVVIQTVR